MEERRNRYIKKSLSKRFKKGDDKINKDWIKKGEKCRKGKVGYKATKKHRENLSKALKGKPSSMLGKHHSENTKKKISNSLKGHLVSKELREKLSRINKNMSEDTKKKMSNAKKGTRLGLKQRERISEALMGKMPKNIQREGIYGNIKRGYYNINGKEIFFRSKAEANYALYLDFLVKQRQIKKWEYEKDVFIFNKIKFGTRSYRPDFKIYELDNNIVYHEVKGRMTPKSKTQIKRMAKYYPEKKLIIIDYSFCQEIKKKLGRMLKFY